jgi:hypothetical protein
MLNPFEFQNHLFFYYDIDPIAAIKGDTLVYDRQSYLSLKYRPQRFNS